MMVSNTKVGEHEFTFCKENQGESHSGITDFGNCAAKCDELGDKCVMFSNENDTCRTYASLPEMTEGDDKCFFKSEKLSNYSQLIVDSFKKEEGSTDCVNVEYKQNHTNSKKVGPSGKPDTECWKEKNDL